jgi:hypothetical protein
VAVAVAAVAVVAVAAAAVAAAVEAAARRHLADRREDSGPRALRERVLVAAARGQLNLGHRCPADPVAEADRASSDRARARAADLVRNGQLAPDLAAAIDSVAMAARV